MDMKSVIGCSNQTVPRQGLRGDRKALLPTTRPSRPPVRNIGCRAAAEPATQDEVAAAVEADPSDAPVPNPGSNGNEQAAPTPDQAPRGRRPQTAKFQLDDLKVGEWYDGVVASTASYGVFFDIGAGKAGLCHVSQLSEEFVSDGATFLQVGEERRVRVLSVDPQANRMSLSLLEPNVKASSPRRPQGEPGQERRLRSDRPSGGRGGEGGGGRGMGRGRGRGARSEGFAASSRSQGLPMPDVNVGDKITAKVKRIEKYGLFLSIEEGKKDGLMTPANMGLEGPATDSDYSMGQEVEVWVASMSDGKIALSILSPEERKAIDDATGGKGTASAKSKGPKAESGLSAMALAFQNVGLAKPKAPEPEPVAAPKEAEPEAPKQAEPTAQALPAVEAPPAAPKEAEPEAPKEAEPTAQAVPAVEAPPADEPAVEQPAKVEEAAPKQPEEVQLDPEAVPSAEAPAPPAAQASPAAETPPAAEAPPAAQAAPVVEDSPADAAAVEKPAEVEAVAAPEKPEEVQLDPEAVPSAQATPDAPKKKAKKPLVKEEVKEEEPAIKEEAPVATSEPEAPPKADSINLEDSLANLQPEPAQNSIHSSTPPKEADLPEVEESKPGEEPATIQESSVAALAEERSAPGAEDAPAAKEEATTSEPSNPVEAAVEAAKDTAAEAQAAVAEAAQPAVEAAEKAKDTLEEAAPLEVGESPKAKKGATSKASKPAKADGGKAKGEDGGAAKAAGGAAVSAKVVKELREKTGAGMMECKKALQETAGDMEEAVTFLRKKGLAGADKKAGRIATEGLVSSYIHAGSGIGVLIEVNCETDFVARGDIFKGLCSDLAMQIAAFGDVVAVSADDIDPAVLEKEREIEMGKDDILSKPEDRRAMIVEGRIKKSKARMSLMDQPYIKDNAKDVQSVVKETIAQLGENIKVRRFERYVLGEGVQKKVANLAKEVEEQKAKMKEEAEARAQQPKEEEVAEPSEEKLATFKVDAKAVSELRKASGAGMMDCKRALAANDGDLEKSKDYLRKKGLASADKKAGRLASEGAVASYIHGSRLGILVEVNCETDFVAKGDVFQTLAADMAMQLASNAQVEAISKDDFPQENLEKERQVALQMEDIQSKPENIREKIVDGRLSKFAAERSLLEQAFIKDTKITVGQHIKETIAKLGENISVRRFTRYNLGEGLAKREENFAEEIAKASAAK